uniref:Anaphase-promoting complex subunit 2 n=1 Tax=Anthurium amnicola TaxID=1678845 RepID=A0A1D1YV26_9ARAE
MSLKYGYVIGEQIGNQAATEGKLITPLKVPEVISLSVVNSSRFMIFGTKPEILEWIRTHSHIKLEVHLFDNENEAPHIQIPDIMVDLLPSLESNQNKSLLDYVNPLHHPNPSEEGVRLEFRPQNSKNDDSIEPYFRLSVKRNSSFGEIIDDLQQKWDSIVYPSVWDNLKNITSSLSSNANNENNSSPDSIVVNK